MRRNTFASLLVALGLVLVLAPLALAQQPPPAWKQGQPSEMSASPLAPIPLPPAPVPAAQIQLSKVKLPPGFSISVWADGIHNARAMAFGSKGTVFLGSRIPGNVYAVVDQGGRRVVKVIAKGLTQPSGVVFKDGTLYVAEIPRILKYENIEANLDSPPAPKVVYEFPKSSGQYGGLTTDAHHNWRYLTIGPDNKFYFNMGAPCNICMPPETHANIARLNLDGTGFEYVARGVRNSVGFDFHPTTKELYFTNHGRDWLGDDLPNDTLHHAPRAGLHFGYPFCHQGDVLDPEFGRGKSCSDYAPPLLKLGPHVAPMGIKFYTASLFPAEYRNRMFIALKGSWNRTVKNGYKIMTVDLKPGAPPKYETFADGFVDGNTIVGRPTYIEWMPDGSMLVSDDFTGAIYHITYRR
jgi:glucose/arabinose dehydrogenase